MHGPKRWEQRPLFLCYWNGISKTGGVDEAVKKQRPAVTTATDSCRCYSSHSLPPIALILRSLSPSWIPSKQLYILGNRHLPSLCPEIANAKGRGWESADQGS